MNTKSKYIITALLTVVLSLSLSESANAVPLADLPTKVLQKITVPQTNYEVVLGIGEMAPNSIKSLHAHSKPEMIYVLEGQLAYMPQGQPEKIIKAGESFQFPVGVLHRTKAGPEGTRFLATWVRE